MSWKKTCYISAEPCPNSVLTVKGPDATRFLATYTTPNYENFFVGRIKHAIITDDQGYVQQNGMIMRFAEDEFRICGFSLGVAHRVAEEPLEGIQVPSVPGDFDGVRGLTSPRRGVANSENL